MDDERRAQLAAKYKAMAWPPDPDNPIAAAALAAERIAAGAHGRDNAPLFDPAWSRVMWERANTATDDLLTRIALPNDDPNRIRLSDIADSTDIEHLPDDAVVVWRVGAPKADVGRAKQQHIDWHTWAIQIAQEVDDYWCYTTGITPYPADYELQCTVNMAPDCTAPLSRDVSDYGGGTTRLMVVHRGRFVLLFRCCTACEALAGQTADRKYKDNVVARRADLPKGTVILPTGGAVDPPE
ncbi:hypothetical protein [Mycobacterium kiyosense]|uniref:Uncharacterized protein n=2 Tax=Mycobacterium kiyosense TaxID=2871094 RepID=A0A9P3V1B1_9MYCO|nr:hypothetical protein [Mycobacterium kiyosense]GLB83492.1 hypothetical protein SRL2020028_27480 [Mycobacterium kiyosense]GLB94309.1 hypothetical protein SRL2020226_10850 [Mycobacterium kiyosense]GLD32642.1 hypothetical protein Mkiyose1413_45250 [Mycobacterium kiyosense]GLD37217.1 hypothetical protein Mkiyose1595_34370 [Mycobacterium kiyosense]